jgi:hypothetical protein
MSFLVSARHADIDSFPWGNDTLRCISRFTLILLLAFNYVLISHKANTISNVSSGCD